MSEHRIRLNRIDKNSIVVDWNKFLEKYKVFKVNASEKIPYDSYLMDSQSCSKKILSVFRPYSRCIYILGVASLTRHDIENAVATLSSELVDLITIQEQFETELMGNPQVLLQLLFNSLGNYESHDSCKLNNMTGHLYCWEEANLNKDRMQFPCIEFKIDRDLNIQLDAVMFSNIKLKNHFNECKNKPESLPRYKVGPNFSFERCYDRNEKDFYVQRALKGTKQSVNFVAFRTYVDFKKSKMGYLYNCMQKFHRRYDGLVTFGFEEELNLDEIRQRYSDKEKFKLNLEFMLQGVGVRVKDYVCDHKSNSLREKIVSQFNELSIPLRNSSPFVISIVHEKDYYKGVEDPYALDIDGYTQHVTLESFKGKTFSKSIALCLIKELLIKQDIEKGYISMTDWQQFGFTQDVRFVSARERKSKDEPIIIDAMTVHPDGTFDFSSLGPSRLYSIANAEYEAVMNKLDLDEEGFVEYGPDINLIRKTPLFPLPDYDAIGDWLKANPDTRFSRSNANKDTVFYSILDMKLFRKSDVLHYISGPMGDHINDAIANASVVRKIDALDGSGYLGNRILSLLDNFFVRNLSQTVIPFPFKYLREYQSRL